MVDNSILSIPRNGLAAEFLLDGNVLDTNDGTKHDGTPQNITYASTSVGYQKQHGVFVGGATSKFTVSSGFPILSNSFTVNLWIANTNISQTGTYVYEKGDYSNGNRHAIIYGYVANSYEFFSTVFRGGTIAISDTDFHMLTYQYDGSTFSAYLDNVLISSQSVSFVLNDFETAFTYGQTHSYASGPAHNASAVRFYTRPLTDTERLALYLEGKRKLGNEGYPKTMKNAVAIYDFREDNLDIVSGLDFTTTGTIPASNDRFGLPYARNFSNNGANRFRNATGVAPNSVFSISAYFNGTNLTQGNNDGYICSIGST